MPTYKVIGAIIKTIEADRYAIEDGGVLTFYKDVEGTKQTKISSIAADKWDQVTALEEEIEGRPT
jgi:hypothetical protein